MPKPPKRPRDMMQLAKLVGDIATGDTEDELDVPMTPTQERASKGGQARAAKLSKSERAEIAKKGGSAPHSNAQPRKV